MVFTRSANRRHVATALSASHLAILAVLLFLHESLGQMPMMGQDVYFNGNNRPMNYQSNYGDPYGAANARQPVNQGGYGYNNYAGDVAGNYPGNNPGMLSRQNPNADNFYGGGGNHRVEINDNFPRNYPNQQMPQQRPHQPRPDDYFGRNHGGQFPPQQGSDYPPPPRMRPTGDYYQPPAVSELSLGQRSYVDVNEDGSFDLLQPNNDLERAWVRKPIPLAVAGKQRGHGRKGNKKHRSNPAKNENKRRLKKQAKAGKRTGKTAKLRQERRSAIKKRLANGHPAVKHHKKARGGHHPRRSVKKEAQEADKKAVEDDDEAAHDEPAKQADEAPSEEQKNTQEDDYYYDDGEHEKETPEQGAGEKSIKVDGGKGANKPAGKEEPPYYDDEDNEEAPADEAKELLEKVTVKPHHNHQQQQQVRMAAATKPHQQQPARHHPTNKATVANHHHQPQNGKKVEPERHHLPVNRRPNNEPANKHQQANKQRVLVIPIEAEYGDDIALEDIPTSGESMGDDPREFFEMARF